MWVEIKFEKYYTLEEVADLFDLTVPTIRKKCKEWDIECSNIGNENRANYLIKGENILNFLNK